MRVVLSIGAIGVVLFALGVVLLSEAPRRVTGERPEDFVQLYVLSWNLRHGGPLYEVTRTPPALEARLGWGHESDHSFANPPALVPVVYPLAFFPYATAWWGLLLVSAFALSSAMVLATREAGLSWVASLTAGALLLASPPSLVLLVLNHLEGLVILLGTLGWIALRRGRLRTGGALWGLCAAFKLFPALWVLALFGKRHRPAFWAAITSGTIATVLGSVIVGRDELGIFFSEVLPRSARWQVSYANHSLLGLGSWLGSPTLGWLMAVTVASIAVVVTVRRDASVDRIWVTTVAASVLASPLAWSYYFPFAAPCVAALAGHLALSRARDRVTLYALCLGLFAWPSLLGGWSEGWLDWAPHPLELVLTFVPTFALLGLLTIGLRRIDRNSASEWGVRRGRFIAHGVGPDVLDAPSRPRLG